MANIDQDRRCDLKGVLAVASSDRLKLKAESELCLILKFVIVRNLKLEDKNNEVFLLFVHKAKVTFVGRNLSLDVGRCTIGD